MTRFPLHCEWECYSPYLSLLFSHTGLLLVPQRRPQGPSFYALLSMCPILVFNKDNTSWKVPFQDPQSTSVPAVTCSQGTSLHYSCITCIQYLTSLWDHAFYKSQRPCLSWLSLYPRLLAHVPTTWYLLNSFFLMNKWIHNEREKYSPIERTCKTGRVWELIFNFWRTTSQLDKALFILKSEI